MKLRIANAESAPGLTHGPGRFLSIGSVLPVALPKPSKAEQEARGSRDHRRAWLSDPQTDQAGGHATCPNLVAWIPKTNNPKKSNSPACRRRPMPALRAH